MNQIEETPLLAEKIIEGDVRSTARLIRLIDDGDPSVNEELRFLYRHAKGAHIIGFTGSPGVGKSTLVDLIATKFREEHKTVGILAVDPTSPFTGGAILGDRVRMQRHFLDDGVFIRSMATRGSFGGLTRSTADAIVVLDAMGKDAILVETVGVGQDEVDIVNNAHTTVLVTIPGMGDDIQAIKAGLMEIGDIFVVNKADREGTAKTVKEIRFMLGMSQERREAAGWLPPVIETVALDRTGVDELYKAIIDHRTHLESSSGNALKRVEEERIRNRLLDLLRENLMVEALRKLGGVQSLEEHIQEILNKNKDPYGVSLELVARLLGGLAR
ncbi:MAG: methylmalonyl Co-A mutase-associated GTPase MeaB [Thermodesulfobacteriota bacterium]